LLSSFLISYRKKQFVFSSSKFFRQTDKLVLIRRWSQTPTANNCGLKKTAFNHPMPERMKAGAPQKDICG